MNQKRYWLTGGIILVSLYILITVWIVINARPNNFTGLAHFVFSFPGTLFMMFLFDVLKIPIKLDPVSMWWIVFMISVVFYFIVGSALGKLIGKLKNKFPL